MFGDQIGRAALAMAHDKHVGMHRRQIGHGVEQGLALGGRTARDVEVQDIGRQTLCSDLEGGAGAGAVLEEQIENTLAAQQRHFLDFAVIDRQKRPCGIENLVDDRLRQAFDRQQVDQLTMLVQLRVASGQHGSASLQIKTETARVVFGQTQVLPGPEADTRG